MPRVVPSEVVRFIDSIQLPEHSGVVWISNVDPAYLRGTLALINRVPDDLLTMGGDAYVSLIHAAAEIEEILAIWTSNRNAGHAPRTFQFAIGKDPFTRIRSALVTCPDAGLAPGTSDLSFITDLDLRTDLRVDFGTIDRALANGEWKPATVVAGAAAEALLLWALQQRTSAEIASAIAVLRKRGSLSTNPDPNQLEAREWNLYGYIQVAEYLGIIKEKTAVAARLAKDFRDLIHPGRALRLAEKCDRATAHSAVAGMTHIVRDLS